MATCFPKFCRWVLVERIGNAFTYQCSNCKRMKTRIRGKQ